VTSHPVGPHLERPAQVRFPLPLCIHSEREPGASGTVSPSIWEVIDAPSFVAPAVPVLPDLLPSASPAGAAAVDLRGARLSAAAPCREPSAMAAPEPGGDPDALPDYVHPARARAAPTPVSPRQVATFLRGVRPEMRDAIWPHALGAARVSRS